MNFTVRENLHALQAVLQESAATQDKLVQEVCAAFAARVNAGALVYTREGARLAACGTWFEMQDNEKLDKLKPAKLLAADAAKVNVSLRALRVLPEKAEDMPAVVIPLRLQAAPVGTLLLCKAEPFDDNELACAEWLGSVLSLVLGGMCAAAEDDTKRQRKIVRAALGALSYSELEAVISIFTELTEREGLVVASKVADQVGITRSVIVNALRKLESATVIETRSLGMKGTYIRITNAYLMDELHKLNN